MSPTLRSIPIFSGIALLAMLFGMEAPQAFGQGGGFGNNSPTLRPEEASTYRAPQYSPTGESVSVAAVRIVGNSSISRQRIVAMLNTRDGRAFDDEIVQADVRALAASRLFSNVRTYREETAEGIIVTFEVFERNVVQYLRYVGNDGIRDSVLSQETGIELGQSLDTYSVEEGRRKIEEFYRGRGFSGVHVAVLEGNEPEHQGIVYSINEGGRQRVFRTLFEGNTIASNARLKTIIQSKPGYFYFIKGEVKYDQIDADVNLLISYYRALGYFRARIGREIEWGESGRWATITFVIDEGPRYQVRNISFAGNSQLDDAVLQNLLSLKPGEAFDLSKMNSDVRELTDIFGGQGYIFADIQANPRFLEEPGVLDIVYDVDMGDQYRVGRVNIHIDGDFTTTRHNVVMNRLSLRPGDIIDIREIRASERRLTASQLFLNEPAQGKKPRIVVQPPELREGGTYAEGPSSGRSTVRGQQPSEDRTSTYRPNTSQPRVRLMDIHVYPGG